MQNYKVENVLDILFKGPISIFIFFKTYHGIGESWGMANDGEWRTGQYLVEGVKVIKCFQPRMLTPPMARVNTN